MVTKAQVLAVAQSRKMILALTSLASASAGATGAFVVLNKRLETKYRDISDKEIEEAKAFYGKLYKSDETTKTPEQVLEDIHGKDAVDAVRSYQGTTTEEDLDDAVELLEEATAEVANAKDKLTQMPEPVDYRAVSSISPKKVTKNVFDNKAKPWDYEEELLIRAEHPELPYIISLDEFNENDGEFEQVTLTYYEADDTLADERDATVPTDTVGEDALINFGHGSNDPLVVYVRSEEREMDFEIHKSTGKYTSEVLGFLEHSEKPRSRKFKGHYE